MIGIRPDDAWWPDETSWTEGQNQTWPYFFVIVEANDTITGGEEHQSTFVAVREYITPCFFLGRPLSCAGLRAEDEKK